MKKYIILFVLIFEFCAVYAQAPCNNPAGDLNITNIEYCFKDTIIASLAPGTPAVGQTLFLVVYDASISGGPTSQNDILIQREAPFSNQVFLPIDQQLDMGVYRMVFIAAEKNNDGTIRFNDPCFSLGNEFNTF